MRTKKKTVEQEKNKTARNLWSQSGAGGILFSDVSICEWVCESVHPKNLVNTISQNQ